jgi:hypothetical protein
MNSIIPLLRSQRSTSNTGLEQFIEALEPRCLLSAVYSSFEELSVAFGVRSSPAKVIVHAPPTPTTQQQTALNVSATPLNYYAGAGTLYNAFSPMSVDTSSLATPAPTPPQAAPNIPGLEPSSAANSLPVRASAPGGSSSAVLGANSLAVIPAAPGSASLSLTLQIPASLWGSMGVSPFSDVAPQFPLSSDFIAVGSVTHLLGATGGISVLAD